MHEDFKLAISTFKRKRKKIVMCHGVFDVIHSGHIEYFKQAKNLGDILVVSVTTDKFVNKGPFRPINTIKDRINVLKNLAIVDLVIQSDYETAEKNIDDVKPDIYCKGPDYIKKNNKDINLKKELNTLKKNKGKFITVKHIKKSSNKIIKSNDLDLISKNDLYSKHVLRLRTKFKKDIINNSLLKLKNNSSFILGELIIDIYNFLDVLGKSGKEPMLVYKENSKKKFLGGSALIANICSTFSKNTNYIFCIGEKNNEINFIKKKLNKKLRYNYLVKKNSNTFTKMRYLDSYKNIKILGIYDIDEKNLDIKIEKQYLNKLKLFSKKVDTIILVDYSHGEITKNIKKNLLKFKQKLFVNSQLNSNNIGSYSLDKYKNINTLCVNENELRFGMKDYKSPLRNLAKKLITRNNYKNLIVTKGKFGSYLFRSDKDFFCPAFVQNPDDTIGSGDAFFSIASLCLSAKIEPDLCLFFASIAASYTVSNLGNDKYFDYDIFKKNLEYLFN